MADIIDFASERKNRERRRPAWGSYDAAQGTLAPAEKIELEYEGGLIWRQLKKHPGKLKYKDRIQIARNLHDLKEKHRIKTSELIKAADLEDYGAKEWYRLALPPGGDPKKHGLRAHKTNYMRLIEGIHRLTGVPRSIIAEDACRYTSLHSEGAQDLTREENVFYALQTWAARINDEHGLLEHYRATAEARIALLKQGGKLRWPTFPELGYLEDPMEADYDPKYAFWPGDRARESSQLCWHEFIPYLPHVFLGFVDTSFLDSGYDDSNYFPGGSPGQCILDAADGGPSIAWDPDTVPPRLLVNGGTWQAFEQRLWEARDAYFADAWGALAASGETVESLLKMINPTEPRPREYLKLVAAHMRRTGRNFDPSPYIAYCWHGDFPTPQACYDDFDRHIPPMTWLAFYPDQDFQRIVPVLVEMILEGPQQCVSWRSILSPRELDFGASHDLPFLSNKGSERQLYLLEQLMKILNNDNFPEEWERTLSFVQYNPILQERKHQDTLENGVSNSLKAAINYSKSRNELRKQTRSQEHRD